MMTFMQAFRVQLTDLLSTSPPNPATSLPCITALLSVWASAVPSLPNHPESSRYEPATSAEAPCEPAKAGVTVPKLHQQLQQACAAGAAPHAQNLRSTELPLDPAGPSMSCWRLQDPSCLLGQWVQSIGLKQWAWPASSVHGKLQSRR